MNQHATLLSDKVEQLLDVLEKDIQHLEQTSQHLNKLRGLVIKRNEKGLGQLLEQIRTQAEQYGSNEQNRELLRMQLSGQLGCESSKLTLTVLKKQLDEPARTAVAEKQNVLKNLVRCLQGEFTLTVSLLSDCARINTLLLKAVFERGRAEPVFYNSSGATIRQSDAAFMNMRL